MGQNKVEINRVNGLSAFCQCLNNIAAILSSQLNNKASPFASDSRATLASHQNLLGHGDNATEAEPKAECNP